MRSGLRPERRGVTVIDPNHASRVELGRILGDHGFEVTLCDSVKHGFEALGAEEDGVLLADLALPEVCEPPFLDQLEERDPSVLLVCVADKKTLAAGLRQVSRGAYDCLVRPWASDDILIAALVRAHEYRRLRAMNRELEQCVGLRDRFRGWIGHSPAMQPVITQIDAAAAVSLNVLVEGEEGTGRSLVAWTIHQRSRRAERPFLRCDCSVFTADELDAVLFGSAGAGGRQRLGILHEAAKGTVFLHYLEHLPEGTQERLERALGEGRLPGVGRGQVTPLDVRIVGSSQEALRHAVERRRFRPGLFELLSGITINVPPLRRRISDLPLLAQHFLDLANARLGTSVLRIEPEALSHLARYSWPGNLQELEHTIANAVSAAPGETLTAELFTSLRATAPSSIPAAPLPNETLARAGAAFERSYLEHVLRRAHGNAAEAARQAGLDRSNFRRLLKRYGIDRKTFLQG